MWVLPDVVGLFSINAGPRHQIFSANLGPKPRMLSGPESYVLGPLHLVTGGSRGIGAAIAQRFLDAGAKVVVAARTRSDDTPAAATLPRAKAWRESRRRRSRRSAASTFS
jgi:short chain dehydrogenase